MERESFVFYRSWFEAISYLPKDIQGEVVTAIIQYGLNGIATADMTPVAKAIITMIIPQIEANNKKYENGKKGAGHGKKGGRPPKGKTPEKPQENPKETPNVNDNDYANDNDIIRVESADSTSELSFENAWELYGKKGNRKTSKNKWDKLSRNIRKSAIGHIPLYIKATPDRQYRKDFQTYINQEAWNDEIILQSETRNEQQTYTIPT